ncbi:MFS transporter [Alteraurantiacibacter palmitatis]|uniref:MFS transporter n=1 Tax=Alteraurantiacibacter palmitatis TaxID=2054628 RepID=A0ABV7E7B5_9SPHN
MTSPWPRSFAPLRHGAFALMMGGVLLTNLGHSVEGVGAAWHLTASGAPADVVALVQTALNLPILLLALPAGAWADMHDKRRIIIGAHLTMLAGCALLIALTGLGMARAAPVIVLTGVIACSAACFGPAMGASIRSVVPGAELAAAVALNILIFNAARAIGPALGGAIVSAGGAQAAFGGAAVFYVAALALYIRWRGSSPPPETRLNLAAMIGEGLRAAAQSREIRTILARASLFTLAGAAAWALMPLVAAQMLGRGASTYGILLGALGLGAVIGAASATWLRQRLSAEAITGGAGLVYGAACLGVAAQPGLAVMLALLVVAGAGWVQALSGFSVSSQLWAPRHAVGRIVAMASALTFGGLALGSWLWGHVAQDFGVGTALAASGAAMIALPLLGRVLPMPAHEAG